MNRKKFTEKNRTIDTFFATEFRERCHAAWVEELGAQNRNQEALLKEITGKLADITPLQVYDQFKQRGVGKIYVDFSIPLKKYSSAGIRLVEVELGMGGSYEDYARLEKDFSAAMTYCDDHETVNRDMRRNLHFKGITIDVFARRIFGSNEYRNLSERLAQQGFFATFVCGRYWLKSRPGLFLEILGERPSAFSRLRAFISAKMDLNSKIDHFDISEKDCVPFEQLTARTRRFTVAIDNPGVFP